MEIIKLNLIPNGVNPVCHASQYDNGRVIRGELFDGLTPYTLASGDVVALNVRKPDNHVVTATLTATAGNSYVDIVTTEQMTACFGENLCELKITNGNTEIGTINFYMIVERDVLANGDPSQSVIEDLEAMVQEAVGDNYYTKTETDNLLIEKADKLTTYTKAQTDALIRQIIEPIELSSIDETMFEYVGNYYVSTNGDKTALSGYYAFQLVAPCDFKVAIPDNLNNDTVDPILGVFNNGEWSRANFVSPRHRYPNLPTSSNMLSVNEGQLFVICLYNLQDFVLPVDDYIIDGYYELNENLSLSNKQIEQVKNRVSVSIVSQDKYTIKFGKMQLSFEHEVDTPTNKDLWTIRGINCGDNVICTRGTDIIGVLREIGQTDFMGGLHGDEHVINMNIYGDSVPITSDGDFETVEIIMFSHLYRPSDSTNVIDRIVNIVITANCLEITTTFKCLVNNFQLDYAYNGGMFAWIDTAANFQISNVGIIDSQSGTSNRTLQVNKNLIQTFANIGGCNVTIENIKGYELSTFLGEVYYYGSSDKRIKTYFSTENNTTWSSGHICMGKARYKFS